MAVCSSYWLNIKRRFRANKDPLKMGNCLKAQSNDDISLLRGNENQESVEQALGPPPPYQAWYLTFNHASNRET
ncbi:hypothetical protein MAR_037032 [Mya arenaria]|uniref:Uncharacterized protein n=1 Tax=Mya arenaria TaxID=6604 RepID=A0ABY7FRH0_MYAAR|nr:hypothetical protein MAR_037032 [Mya arenaria]